MDDEAFVRSRRSGMRWNAPLSEAHAEVLLDRLGPGEVIADLGCGWGELLLRAVARGGDGARGIGADTDPVALARGRELARQRGLHERVQFVDEDLAQWWGSADRVLCVGSSHAFGGTEAALAALAALVPPGGRVLYGDGCWPGEATEAAKEIFGEDVLPLPELLETCRTTGWRVLHLSTADQREWDEFESSSRVGRQEWLLANEDDPRAAEVRDWLDTRERQYVRDYRGVLGFAYLVLAR
jgi:SAM-dependent methyltransferase